MKRINLRWMNCFACVAIGVCVCAGALAAQAEVPPNAVLQELAYIESTGTQYIDTGVKINSGTDEVEIEFAMTSYSTDFANGIFGSRVASKQENYTLQFTAAHNILFSCANESDSIACRFTEGAVNTRYIVRASKSSRTIVNAATSATLASDKTQLAEFSSSKNAYIFCANMEASATWLKSKVRLYGCKITRGGEPLRDFVPCRALVDGVEKVCLYDRVSKGFFADASGGSFVESRWVESRWRYWLGVDNVRDFGGMTTTDGRTVRTNRIYRSQAFNDNAICDWLTAARLKQRYEDRSLWYLFGRDNSDELVQRFDHGNLELSYQTVAAALVADHSLWRAGALRGTAESRAAILAATGIKTEIDLRSTSECYGMTGSPLGASVNWVNLPSDSTGNWYYSSEGKAFFKSCFPYFLDEANYPIDFHCIAGADRTGCLAYVLGALLGIGEEQLLEDYEMTSLSSSGVRDKTYFQSQMRNLTNHYSGSTIGDKMAAYAADCGFTGEDIATFRSLVLKPANQ